MQNDNKISISLTTIIIVAIATIRAHQLNTSVLLVILQDVAKPAKPNPIRATTGPITTDGSNL